ncbi:TRMT1 [Blepharisma stoltei]|uniref:tRNA (guanine(26)-N(2))-dimethyltransferase n=1 Tax=Blepharisma stoltei TaxID=1481888 RepID=A0AAU9K0G8_9CILI|nr:unnamed protein product [Blepharisma stoltei]
MALHIEGSAQVLLKSGVFLNPAQVFNRDMSVLVTSVYAQRLKTKLETQGRPFQGLNILEPMAASGIRSIRYYKEINQPIQRLIANDLSPEAVEEIKQNFESNNVMGEVTQADACEIMYRNKGVWDIVDLDPYGSVASFIDAGVQAVKSGGLLCVTSTDVSTLCGNNPDTCFYKYQSIPTKAKHCHEFALRVLLYQLNASANKYQLVVKPLLSLSVDFYVRVFVQVISSALEAKKSIAKSALVFQCTQCPAYYLHYLGREGRNKYTTNVFEGHSVCPECGGKFLIQGPIYAGNLHEKDFVDEVIQTLEERNMKTHDKLKGVLVCVKDELDIPLNWDLSMLCKFFKSQVMSQKQFRSAVRSSGLNISQSHTHPMKYKINVEVSQLFDIFRHWKKTIASDRYISNLPEDSAAVRVLNKEPKTPCPDFEQELTEHEQSVLSSIRFPPNEANWGPKPRAKRQADTNIDESKKKKQEIEDDTEE